ncbi:serine/threonine-protein kinase [Actinosynnema sp. CA-299493]
MHRNALIASRYRLDEQIGVGGMGVVWRATDTELGRQVALKRSSTGDGGQIRREARMGAGLHHPHVVTVFDVVVDAGDRWLVMEYLHARSLSAVLQVDGPLVPEAAARLGAQIAAALAAMHERGMVHRDVTPGNILLAEDDTAKLTDLGIARWAEVTLTGDAQIAGTPAYLAPEVAAGGEARASSDVFSLGAALFTAVLGHPPLRSGDEVRGWGRVMTGEQDGTEDLGALAPVLARLLRHDPAERPSAVEAKELLEAVAGVTIPPAPLSDPTPLSDPVPPIVSGRRWPGRRALRLTVAAVVVVGLAVGSVVYFTADRSHPSDRGTVGDKRTADPCALLDPATMFRFGENPVQVDSEYGGFNQCGLVLRLDSREDNIAEVRLEILDPPEYEVQPHTPGELGPIRLEPERDGVCRRPIPLADGNEVLITARNQGGHPSEVCAMADAVASAALARLGRGPIPRRTEPFPSWSLAHVDACGTLAADDLATAFAGIAVTAEPAFGNWTCYWEDGPLQVTVGFAREWRESPEEGETVLRIGASTATVDLITSGDGDEGCEVDLPRRGYDKDTAIHDEWVETATVTLETSDESTAPRACAPARSRSRGRWRTDSRRSDPVRDGEGTRKGLLRSGGDESNDPGP